MLPPLIYVALVSHANLLGSRVIAPLTLALSLYCEHSEALPDALAVLTAGL